MGRPLQPYQRRYVTPKVEAPQRLRRVLGTARRLLHTDSSCTEQVVLDNAYQGGDVHQGERGIDPRVLTS